MSSAICDLRDVHIRTLMLIKFSESERNPDLPVAHAIGRGVAEAEAVPHGHPEPVVPQRGESVDITGDPADCLVHLDPVSLGVLRHLDHIVRCEVGSQREGRLPRQGRLSIGHLGAGWVSARVLKCASSMNGNGMDSP